MSSVEAAEVVQGEMGRGLCLGHTNWMDRDSVERVIIRRCFELTRKQGPQLNLPFSLMNNQVVYPISESEAPGVNRCHDHLWQGRSQLPSTMRVSEEYEVRIKATGVHVTTKAGAPPVHTGWLHNVTEAEFSRASGQYSRPCLQSSGPSIVQHSGHHA